MSSPARRVEALLPQVIAKLGQTRRTVTTVESCTGGWIAQMLTSEAGSSNWFECGFVTYSNQSKQELVGVCEDTLAQHGAVSRAVAREMAAGGLRCSRADITVAVTGIAGPDGGAEAKPVGTVWIAWANRSGGRIEKNFLFEGDRQTVRILTVESALLGLLEFIG